MSSVEKDDRDLRPIDYCLIVGCVLSGIACFVRPDYNLGIFISAYYVWSKDTPVSHNLLIS